MADAVKVLTFTDLALDDVLALKKTSSRVEMRSILEKCMKVDAEIGVAAEILVEFHLQNYLFCRQTPTLNTPEKVSTILSIMRIVYEDAIGERKPVSVSFQQMKDIVSGHAKQTPPYSVGVFTPEDQAMLVDYACKTFFRHYKMYQYVYLKRRELDLKVQRDDLAQPVVKAYSLNRGVEADPKEVTELAGFFDWGSMRDVGASLREEQLLRPPPPEVEEAGVKLEGALQAFDTTIRASDEKLEALMQK